MASTPDDDDPAAELREAIEIQLRAGFREPDDVAEWCAEAFEELEDALPLARRHAATTAERLAGEARAWPDVTDCDRIDRAFEALEAAGIVARQNFSCCGTCAPGELVPIMEAIESSGRTVRGYAYFHEQDTEHAVSDGSLCFGYGPRDPDDASDTSFVAIGNEVADALRAQGFALVWDGTADKRIAIRLVWQRRGPWAPRAST